MFREIKITSMLVFWQLRTSLSNSVLCNQVFPGLNAHSGLVRFRLTTQWFALTWKYLKNERTPVWRESNECVWREIAFHLGTVTKRSLLWVWRSLSWTFSEITIGENFLQEIVYASPTGWRRLEQSQRPLADSRLWTWSFSMCSGAATFRHHLASRVPLWSCGWWADGQGAS